jgi:hypothetical protein
MNRAEFAARLNWNEKTIGGRLGALGLLVVCSRCGGSGSYSYCQQYGTKCFGCMGSGKGIPKLTAKLATFVAVRVAAGDLEPYLAKCRATAEARKAVAPLVAECRAAYMTVGLAYEAAYKASRGLSIDESVSAAQTMNNALFYSCKTMGCREPDVHEHRAVSSIEWSAQHGEIDAVRAVAILRERIVQLTELRAEWLMFSETEERGAA